MARWKVELQKRVTSSLLIRRIPCPFRLRRGYSIRFHRSCFLPIQSVLVNALLVVVVVLIPIKESGQDLAVLPVLRDSIGATEGALLRSAGLPGIAQLLSTSRRLSQPHPLSLEEMTQATVDLVLAGGEMWVLTQLARQCSQRLGGDQVRTELITPLDVTRGVEVIQSDSLVGPRDADVTEEASETQVHGEDLGEDFDFENNNS